MNVIVGNIPVLALELLLRYTCRLCVSDKAHYFSLPADASLLISLSYASFSCSRRRPADQHNKISRGRELPGLGHHRQVRVPPAIREDTAQLWLRKGRYLCNSRLF